MANEDDQGLASLVRNKRDNHNNIQITVHVVNGKVDNKPNGNKSGQNNNVEEDEEEAQKKKMRRLKRKCKKNPELKKCKKLSTTPMPDIRYTTSPIQFNNSDNATDYQWNATRYEYTSNFTTGSFNTTMPGAQYNNHTLDSTTEVGVTDAVEPTEEPVEDGEDDKDDTDEDMTTKINNVDIQAKRRSEDEEHIVKDV